MDFDDCSSSTKTLSITHKSRKDMEFFYKVKLSEEEDAMEPFLLGVSYDMEEGLIALWEVSFDGRPDEPEVTFIGFVDDILQPKRVDFRAYPLAQHHAAVTHDGALKILFKLHSKRDFSVQSSFEQLLHPDEADISVIVEGIKIPAHAFLLKSKSSVIRNMFRFETKEALDGSIDMSAYSKEAVECFLSYLYCGDLSGLLVCPQELLRMADYYQIKDLEDKSMQHMISFMDCFSFWETVCVSSELDRSNLTARCKEFLLRHTGDLVMNPKVMQCLLESSCFSDLTIYVGDQQIKVHRCVIELTCSAMLNPESDKPDIVIADHDYETVSRFVRWLYLYDDVDAVASFLIKLHKLAAKYGKRDLCEIVESLFLREGIISTVNSMLVYGFSLPNASDSISKAVIVYVANNYPVTDTETFVKMYHSAKLYTRTAVMENVLSQLLMRPDICTTENAVQVLKFATEERLALLQQNVKEYVRHNWSNLFLNDKLDCTMLLNKMQ